MPVYSYRCEAAYCGEIFEVEHKLGEKPARLECPECHSVNQTHRVILTVPHMKRVLTPVKLAKPRMAMEA